MKRRDAASGGDGHEPDASADATAGETKAAEIDASPDSKGYDESTRRRPRRARSDTMSQLTQIEAMEPAWLQRPLGDRDDTVALRRGGHDEDAARDLSSTGPLPSAERLIGPLSAPSEPDPPSAPQSAPPPLPPRPSSPPPPRSRQPSDPGTTMKGMAVPWAPKKAPTVRPPNPARELNERPRHKLASTPPAATPERRSARDSRNASEPVLELLWSDDDRAEEVTRQPTWGHLTTAPTGRPQRSGFGLSDNLFDAPSQREPEAMDPRKLVTAVLRRADPVELERLPVLLREQLAASDMLAPPLVMVRARLTMQFDVRRELEELIATAKPLSKKHKGLAETLAHAEEMLDTPIEAAPKMARAIGEQLRKSWGEANRMLPSDFLDETVKRTLLDKRAYERRDLLGGTWLRALARDARKRQVVTYLPEALERRLPLFVDIEVRLIADVMPSQESDDNAAVCLRALALARVVEDSR